MNITSCYECPNWIDLREDYCKKLNKPINGIANTFPDNCPLDSDEILLKKKIKVKVLK